MKYILRIREFTVIIILLFSCVQATDRNDSVGNSVRQKHEILIDFTQPKQTIRNFGASDAWVCQFVGLWPEQKRNQAADWLFSLETDAAGKPKGIGLSFWRFNIGSGSMEQSSISDKWRRTEGFLKNDLTYNWSRQAGQHGSCKPQKKEVLTIS